MALIMAIPSSCRRHAGMIKHICNQIERAKRAENVRVCFVGIEYRPSTRPTSVRGGGHPATPHRYASDIASEGKILLSYLNLMIAF